MFPKQRYTPDDTFAATFGARYPLPEWLMQQKQQAAGAWQGIPTPHVETWKYTQLKNIYTLPESKQRPTQGDIAWAVGRLDAWPVGYRAVFVNGAFHTALSQLPEMAGVVAMPLREALVKEPALLQPHLNRLALRGNDLAKRGIALAEDGLFLHIAKGVELPEPLTIAHISTGGAQAQQTYAQHLFVLGEGAQASVHQLSLGVPQAEYSAHVVAEYVLAKHARLQVAGISQESTQGVQLSFGYVEAAEEAVFHDVFLTEGAKVQRHEHVAWLVGARAHAGQHSVQLLNGRLHADCTTLVVHDTVEATSEQHCRIIADDEAQGVFQGKTKVERDAQKTDAHQLNKNLLLSRKAQVDSKPELEIYADDVKCSHGATTGELDKRALFYLESRGISPDDARQLLVEAFAEEVIETAPVGQEMQDVLRAHVARWMQQRKG